MNEDRLRKRAEGLAWKASQLRELGMIARAEQALLIAEDSCALMLEMCERIDALTPYQDEV